MTVDAAAIAAYGLPTTHTIDRVPLDDEAFQRLCAACENHRLLGLLAKAIRDEQVLLTDSQHE